MKLRRNEQVLATIHGTVGVPERHLPTLAGLEIAGAIGILVGLWLEPLGIAAAVGLIAYFLGAVGGHLRVGDTKNLAMPIAPLALAVGVLALRLLTL
jgi:DoxX-like family